VGKRLGINMLGSANHSKQGRRNRKNGEGRRRRGGGVKILGGNSFFRGVSGSRMGFQRRRRGGGGGGRPFKALTLRVKKKNGCQYKGGVRDWGIHAPSLKKTKK